MVSSKNEEILRVFNFVANEKTEGFDSLLSSVNVVSQEEIVGCWRETKEREDSEQIVVLAVYVT